MKSALAVVVTKKSLPRAVDRNRAKRLVREWFRMTKSEFKTPAYIIVRFKGSPKLLYNNELRLILTDLFKSLETSKA